LNTVYLEQAKERINNTPLLINVVSKRVQQLNRGARPLVRSDNLSMSKLDLALKEIAEGKLTAEMAFKPSRPAEGGDNLITL